MQAKNPPEGLITRTFDRIRYQFLGSKDPGRSRVIGVGLPKTGTKTLCDALNLIGYQTIHYPPIASMRTEKPEMVWPWWMSKYDAMADLPAAALYRELAELFPTATFLLTFREEAEWLKSAQKHFTAARIEIMRREPAQQGPSVLKLCRCILGSEVFDREIFLDHYRRHNAAVRRYFTGNPRFFEMDLTSGEGWAPISHALGRPIPDIPFPHSNRRDVAWGSQSTGSAG